jgi:EamA domain-containing membrane protein RarD
MFFKILKLCNESLVFSKNILVRDTHWCRLKRQWTTLSMLVTAVIVVRIVIFSWCLVHREAIKLSHTYYILEFLQAIVFRID